MKIYQISQTSDDNTVYTQVDSLPEGATIAYEKVVYDINQDVVLATDTTPSPELPTSRHCLAVEGKAVFYKEGYITVEWGNVVAIMRGFFGLGYKFINNASFESTEIAKQDEPAYAPYTKDDMELLQQQPMSEPMAHQIAQNDKLVVYKFIGDIEDIKDKSLMYGEQFDYGTGENKRTYTTAFLYARQMSETYINDNRRGKTGDYRVYESWYRVDKAGLNVTAWQVIDLDIEQVRHFQSFATYTGDYDYDTRGRGEYSRKDKTIRGHYDVDEQ